MRGSLFVSTLLVSTALASCFATTALAQSKPAVSSGAGDLEEVVVTARRVAESLQSVPVSVTAVSNERLQQLVVQNVQDLSKLSPSLQTASCQGQRTTCFQPTIRGQGQSSGSGEKSVVAYFAEVPNYNVSYFDLDNLQVLNGPQGTLFGENATGGAVLFSPKRPTNDTSGYFRVQGGGYNYYSAEGAIGGAIVEDKLLVRVAGLMRKRDGFTKLIPSYGGPGHLAQASDADNIDSAEGRISIVFRPTSWIENYTVFSANNFSSNGNGQVVLYTNQSFISPAVRNTVVSADPLLAAKFQLYSGVAPTPGATWGQLIDATLARQLQVGPHTTFTNYDKHNDSRFRGLINQTKFDLPYNITARNILGLFYTQQEGPVLETDASDLPLIDTTAPQNADGSAAFTPGWPSRTFSDEFRFEGSSFDNRLKWQGGVYYRSSGSRSWTPAQGTIIVFATPQGVPSPAASCTSLGGVSPCVSLSRSFAKSKAVFASGTYEVIPNVHVTLGGRHTIDNRSSDATVGPLTTVVFNGQTLPIATYVQPFPGATFVSTPIPETKKNTYTASIDWQATPDILVYGTTRTGYKAGGVNIALAVDSPNRLFGPETIQDFEGGIKTEWSFGDFRGRTNLDVYYDKYDSIQRRSLLPGVASQINTNLADGVIKGLEFQSQVRFQDWFELSGYFAYTDAKYVNWIEQQTCATQFYRPQCAGLPSSTAILINHSKGVLTVNGATTNFKPDLFNTTSKYRFGVQPQVHLRPFIEEDITLSANVYYQSTFTNDDLNYSTFAGNPQPKQTLWGIVSNPLILPGYTLADLRVDWKNVFGRNFNLAASVTNVANKVARTGTAGGLPIAGVVPTVINEPRMWFVEATYNF